MAVPTYSSSIASRSKLFHEFVDGPFWIVLSMVGFAFLATEQDIFLSHSLTSAVGACSRSSAYQFGLLSFGVLGGAWLVRPARRTLRSPRVLIAMTVVGATICLGSLGSGSSSIAIVEKMLSWICLAVGVWGLARQFTVRDLTKLILVLMVSHLAISVTGELMRGSFNPQSSQYRFVGTLTAETQAIYCSLLALSALALLRHTQRHLPLHLGFVALGVLFLVLTKSTTGCFAFLTAILAELFLQPRPEREWRNWSWALGFVSVVLGIGTVTGLASAEFTQPFVRLGSSLLERLSSMGFIGSAYGLLALLGLVQARRQFYQTGEECYRFLVAQIVLSVVHSLMNTEQAIPSICAVACAASVASLMLTPLTSTDSLSFSRLALRADPVDSPVGWLSEPTESILQ